MSKKAGLIILFLFFGVVQIKAGFHAVKLSANWDYWSYSLIQKCDTKIEVYGLFYETTVNLKLKLGKRDYWNYNGYTCQDPPSGNYEFFWDFNLPQDSYIKDFQVWDESKQAFVSAKIISLSTAEQNYQANKSQNLTALLRQYMRRDYYGNYNLQYNMTISPVQWDHSVELIIKFISPCKMQLSKRLITDYSGQFYTPATTNYGCNSNAPMNIAMIDYNNPDTAPKNFSGTNTAWNKSDGFWKTSGNGSYNGSVFELAQESSSGEFLKTYTENENKFYQLAVTPHIDYEKRYPRNIVLAFDLVGQYYNSNWRTGILDRLETPLILSTTDKDSLAVVTSSFDVNWIDNDFVPRTETLINQRLSQVKSIIPKLNTLPYMLKDIAEFLNNKNRDAEVWIVSDDYQTAKRAETVMELLQQSYYNIKNKVKFRILDVTDSYYSYYILNKSYYGNGYLYENLSRLSGGTYESYKGVYTLSQVDKAMDCFAPTVTTVEIDPLPMAGVSFSSVNLNDGRNNFDIADRYFQFGMYDGTPPFNTNFYGYYLGEDYFRNIGLAEDNKTVPDNMVENTGLYWYGTYIMKDLFLQPQSYSTIQYIEDLSVNNRLITPYSGFIVPGPNGPSGFNRIYEDEGEITTVDSVSTNSPPTSYEIELSAYPNPFNPSTNIKISIPSKASDTGSMLIIYNILGQKIRSFDLHDFTNMNSINITWDGLNDFGSAVSSGTYIAVLKTADLMKSIKLLLIR